MIGLLLAQDDTTKMIFGGGITGAPLSGGTVGETFSFVFGFFINLALAAATIYVLVMMIWGAYDWISSGGESDKLKKAQAKIMNALVGLFILIGVLVIWVFLGTVVLGTLKGGGRGPLQLDLPTVRQPEADPEPNMPGKGEPPIPR